MPTSPADSSLGLAARRCALALFTLAESRIELFTVELQEERARLQRVFLLGLGILAFGLLSGMALSAAVVAYWWATAPITALLVVAAIHGGLGALLWWRLIATRPDGQRLPATVLQFRKDRACLERLAS
jgi:uncharacterized membrane protein YqjE